MSAYSDEIRNNPVILWLEKRYQRRQKRERVLQELVGNHNKKSFLYKFDRMIDYSGLKTHFVNLNAEIYIICVNVLAICVGVLLYFLFKNAFLIVSVVCLINIISYAFLYVMSGFYYNRLEKNIMTFLNLIENFNKTEDDIVQIFRITVNYVDEPLKSSLKMFCSEVESSGEISQAFRNLQVRTEHGKCREIFRNIEVCSRYDANYDEIVRDCRASMTDYLGIKSERKAIISNGRAEVVILIASAILIIRLFGGISENMWYLLSSTFVGNIILIYCVVVLFICMIMMVMFDKGEG